VSDLAEMTGTADLDHASCWALTFVDIWLGDRRLFVAGNIRGVRISGTPGPGGRAPRRQGPRDGSSSAMRAATADQQAGEQPLRHWRHSTVDDQASDDDARFQDRSRLGNRISWAGRSTAWACWSPGCRWPNGDSPQRRTATPWTFAADAAVTPISIPGESTYRPTSEGRVKL